MTRSFLLIAAMMFFVPALAGCGGSTETRLIEGNDMAAVQAEEAQAEAQKPAGEVPGAGRSTNNNEP